ncbi:cell wall integrity and stress response protein 1 [Bifidobacterium sp. DSM 109958]|uniref:Cell wall integrity and stress response protein 1 n=1 Tax=Bifidobacterium moraviense TaxID=2675323 RepID=A0A7Y0HZ84_9BIFI|nr:LytR C-terminal domain-containing protein [Bifidobacterium sp. DSM 109958]NMM99934.1 cell wall integrity and stress response protein 1 [Bifidobacterium sp. DSM 109958]
MSNENLTPDEFDNPPAGPVGVHRGPKSVGARMLPYLVVLLVAAVCGLGVWTLTSGLLEGGRMPWQSDAGATTSLAAPSAASSSSSAAASSAASSEATSGTSASPSATASSSSAAASSSASSASPSSTASSSSSSAAATVDKSSSVLVLNGTGRSGYAAQKVSVLESAGYTNATAGNPRNRSTLPDSSAVWYQSEADKATAEDVARQLGIDAVSQISGASAPVVVVLMK